MKADISFLFQNPERDKMALLTVETLAPVSIVSTLPGSHYKSQDKPTKYNLCGMLENALGLHIGVADRKAIRKQMNRFYKKKYKIQDFHVTDSPSGYTSLLGHLFEVELSVNPTISTRYDDLWKQQMKHDDSRHLKGTPNLSWYLIKEKLNIETDDKGSISDVKYGEFLKAHSGDFPMYYTSPTPREFIVPDSAYQFRLSISGPLLEALEVAFQENNMAYLGTSEGWVNLSIKEI